MTDTGYYHERQQLNILSLAVAAVKSAWSIRYPVGILCERFHCIYFPIPKAGSSSVKRAITEAEGLPATNTPHHKYFQLVPAKELHDYPDYVKFTVVRNPWDRLFSCFKDKIQGDLSDRQVVRGDRVYAGFERYNKILRKRIFRPDMTLEEFAAVVARIPDFVSDEHFRSQYRLFSTPDGTSLVDQIIKVEQFDEGLQQLRAKLNAQDFTIKHVHRSAQSDYRRFYTERAAQAVARRYAKDIALLGYSF